MADECHGALDLPTESLDFTHGFSWTLHAGGTPKANGTQDCECNITLVMFADKTACVVTNDAARNTPKVTECRLQAVEPGFLSLEVVGLGEYAA